MIAVTKSRPRWAIFCRVIDNFGDAGVCWRLAQQLAGQHRFAVDLFIDQVEIIERFGRYAQYGAYDNTTLLRVLPWPSDCDSASLLNVPALIPDLSADSSADSSAVSPVHRPSNYEVIVAAFAVVLPASWLALMVDRPVGSWFNLEYLSAEPWVAQCHLLNSIKPITGACETFFFPGFETGTGGLLREPWIKAERTAPALVPNNKIQSTLTISIFCYENVLLQQLLDQLEGCTVTVKLAASGWVFTPSIRADSTLTVEQLPFLSQAQYDQLLAQCDLNFVRGEDSLVRAIWSEKPFIWQIYQQDENAHLVKLEAFLATWCKSASTELKALVSSAHHWWNQTDQLGQGSTNEPTQSLIGDIIAQLPVWSRHAKKRCGALSQAPDLCSALIDASGIIKGLA